MTDALREQALAIARDFGIPSAEATALLLAAIGTPCRFCGETMSEHKLAAYRDSRRTSARVICRRCWMAKGTMTEPTFTRLIEFLMREPEVHRDLWPRLTTGVYCWRRANA